MADIWRKSYKERAEKWTGNQMGKQILSLMASKQSNLCLSADFTTCAELLEYADKIGPEICVLKTHIDILSDFTGNTVKELVKLSKKHNFLIFEDRKFADIGNTVALQYGSGPFKISSWSHFTNAHSVPGEGVITGLRKAALCAEESEDSLIGNVPRGLLMLAEMSSAGSLATDGYTSKTLDMALNNRDFVFGFVAGRRLLDTDDFVYFSPGVQLESGKDTLGQQYRTPEIVLGECRSDVVIVGRGIYESEDPVLTARIYREKCWKAYQSRIST